MTLTVTIGGVTMTGDSHYVVEDSVSHVNALGQRDTFSCRIASADGSYRPALGAPVVVTDDVGARFGGSVLNVSIDQFGAALLTTIQCASWEQIFDRRFVGEQKTFTDTAAGDVFQYVFDNWLTFENLTASVVSSGPNITITLDWCTVREALDTIAQLASSASDTYMWDCTASKVTRFYKQTSFAAPFGVTDASTNVMRPITISESLTNGYGNKVFVRLGNFVTDARTNTYSPDGSQDSLAFELPIAKTPTVAIDGVTQTIGIRDVDTGKQCYWQDGSPDVTFAVAPALGTTVTIEAQGYQSTVVDAGQNDAEVTERSTVEDNSGWYIVLLESSVAGTSSDAMAIAQSWLDKFSRKPAAVEYVTDTNSVRAGMHQAIALSGLGGVSDTFLIESSTLGYNPAGGYYWRVKAVRGALAQGWLAKLRKIATGNSGGTSGGAAGPSASGTSTYSIVNASATPSLSGSGTTGAPFQLPSGDVTVDVTATTQNVYLALPSESTDVGHSVTVNLSEGSTHSTLIRPLSGDTIGDSGSDYEITAPGSVTIEGV